MEFTPMSKEKEKDLERSDQALLSEFSG